MDREPRLFRDRLRDPPGRFEELLARDDLRDHPDLVRALCAHAFVIAEQLHAQHLAERHLLQHVHRLEGGRHAVGHVRVEERRVFRGDDDVDLAQDVEGAAARHAVHGGDHRLPEVVRPRADVLARVVEHERRRGRRADRLAARRRELVAHRLGAVDPGAERLLPRRRYDNGVDVVVLTQRAPRLSKLDLHLAVERVEDVGPVQRDPCDVVALFVDDRLEVQCSASDEFRRC